MFCKLLDQCTEVRFASFLSGGFTTIAVINPPERKLAKTHLCAMVSIFPTFDGRCFWLLIFGKKTWLLHSSVSSHFIVIKRVFIVYVICGDNL